MTSKRFGEQVAALFLAVVAGGFLLDSRHLNYQSEFGRPGPSFFPIWLSMVLLVVAGILFVQATRSSDTEARSSSGITTVGLRRLLRPLLLLVLLALTVALMRTLGFIVAVGLFLTVVMMVLERVQWWKGLLVAGFGTFAFYQLFSVWLGLQLPMGVIFRP